MSSNRNKLGTVVYVSEFVPGEGQASSVVIYRHLKSLESIGFQICVVVPSGTRSTPDAWQRIELPPRKFYYPPYRPTFPLRELRYQLLDQIVLKAISGLNVHCVLGLLCGEYLAGYAGWLSGRINRPLFYFLHDRGESLSAHTNAKMAARIRLQNSRLSALPQVRRVWTVTPELNYQIPGDPKKFKTVFPLPERVLPMGEIRKIGSSPAPALAYAGSLYNEIIDSLRVVASALRKFHGKLVLYSHMTGNGRLLQEEFPDVVESREALSSTEEVCDAISAEATAFLVIYPQKPESMPWCIDCFPSKLTQFVQTGIPGVVIAPKETAVAQWCLKESWPLFSPDGSAESIERLIGDLLDGRRWQEAANASLRVANGPFSPKRLEESVNDDVLAIAQEKRSSLAGQTTRSWLAPFRLTAGRIKTAVYRKPKHEIQRLRNWGPRAYFRMDAWMGEMEQAARDLPAPSAGSEAPVLPVWFLTGRRFWYQTAFCAWTLAHQSGRSLELNLVDDGSLEQQHVEALRRLFPLGVTITKESVQSRIDSHLPESSFPILRQRWSDYVNIRKLTDIHLGSAGTKLVLDSDMLFFRRPAELLQWWDDRQSQTASPANFSPCLMTDCEESYGYSRPLMERLAGAKIPPLLNVGICGLKSEDLDWEEIEFWCRALLEAEGTSYYLEQALVAMLAARHAPVVMPRSDYITFPTQQQVRGSEGVLQHYVADSKPWYFGQAWKLAMQAR